MMVTIPARGTGAVDTELLYRERFSCGKSACEQEWMGWLGSFDLRRGEAGLLSQGNG
jgi:hypothetical protein